MASSNSRVINGKTPRMIIAGNWKMNGLKSDLAQAKSLVRYLSRSHRSASASSAEVVICPPATLISALSEVFAGSVAKTGGQDCHPKESGAHTGDISAEMIKNAGGRYVIVGHSERRSDHAESDKLVRAKAEAGHRAGLVSIICLGESLKDRKQGKTLSVIGRQLKKSLPAMATAKNTILAYEPIWAIGTGLTPTLKEIEQAHNHLRRGLLRILGPDGAKLRILYGGSVKPDNAAEILAIHNVNGALVGGASMKATDFSKIIDAVG